MTSSSQRSFSHLHTEPNNRNAAVRVRKEKGASPAANRLAVDERRLPIHQTSASAIQPDDLRRVYHSSPPSHVDVRENDAIVHAIVPHANAVVSMTSDDVSGLRWEMCLPLVWSRGNAVGAAVTRRRVRVGGFGTSRPLRLEGSRLMIIISYWWHDLTVVSADDVRAVISVGWLALDGNPR